MSLVATGPEQWNIVEDYPIPPLSPGSILLKPLAVGICGSDYKMYKGSEFYWGKNGRCKQGGVIVGHEFVGEIVEISPLTTSSPHLPTENTDNDAFNYSQFKPGDLVAVEQAIQTCNPTCWHCRNGGKNKCDKLVIFGQGADGGATNVVVLQNPHLHPLPQDISPFEAVLAEPLAVSVHAVDRISSYLSQPNYNNVCISGGGMVGLGVVAALHHLYPSVNITVLEPSAIKRSKAIELGAHQAYPPTNPPVPQETQGYDIVFESSGNPDSLTSCFNIVRKRGVICHIGIFKNGFINSIDWNFVSAGKELTIIGSSLGRGAWHRAIDIIKAGGLKGVVTHVLALDDFAQGLQLVDPDNLQGREDAKCIKVVLNPQLRTK